MFIIVSSSHLFGQEKSNVYVGEYLKTRFFYLHNFRINENLSQLGTNKISSIAFTESFGLKLRLENGFTTNLDIGFGGMQNEHTSSLLMPIYAGVGYTFSLGEKKNHYLSIIGNFYYQALSMRTYLDTGLVDFSKGVYSTSFNCVNQQFMLGVAISYQHKNWEFSIGYDIGLVPTKWESQEMIIRNAPKERLHNLHIDCIGYIFDILSN